MRIRRMAQDRKRLKLVICLPNRLANGSTGGWISISLVSAVSWTSELQPRIVFLLFVQPKHLES